MLSEAFRIVAPDIKYTAEHARRLLLQMPLVAVRIGDPKKGTSFVILMEKIPGTDYFKMGSILTGLANSSMPHTFSLEKPVVKMLLSIAESDRERVFTICHLQSFWNDSHYGKENIWV